MERYLNTLNFYTFFQNNFIGFINKNEINLKIHKRLNDLEELSIEDDIDQKNVSISKNKILEFINYVNFYEYPSSIGMDDNGFFTLEINKNDIYAIFIFRNELNFYLYRNKEKIINISLKNTRDFFNYINKSLYEDLFIYDDNSVKEDNSSNINMHIFYENIYIKETFYNYNYNKVLKL